MYVLFHHGGEQEGSPQNCVYANSFDPLIVSHDMKHSSGKRGGGPVSAQRGGQARCGSGAARRLRPALPPRAPLQAAEGTDLLLPPCGRAIAAG